MLPRSYFGGLDLVRFSAALTVMLYHLAGISWVPVGLNYQVPGTPSYEELAWLGYGWVGVETFFVLSGFVIAESAKRSSAFSFLKGRVGRLFPAVAICSTVTLLITISFDLQPARQAIANYIRTLLFDPRGPWIEAVYWTLSLEITFYALIFLLLAIGRFRWVEILAWTLAVSSACYLVGRTAFGLNAVSQHLLTQHGCFFALGIFMWSASTKGITMSRAAGGLLALAAGAIEIIFIAHGRIPNSVAAGLTIGAWLASVMAIWISTQYAWRGNKLTRTLGLMTYPLYLIHETLGTMMLRIGLSKWIALVVAVSSMLCASWCIVQLERPCRRLIETAFDVFAKSTNTRVKRLPESSYAK